MEAVIWKDRGEEYAKSLIQPAWLSETVLGLGGKTHLAIGCLPKRLRPTLPPFRIIIKQRDSEDLKILQSVATCVSRKVVMILQ